MVKKVIHLHIPLVQSMLYLYVMLFLITIYIYICIISYPLRIGYENIPYILIPLMWFYFYFLYDCILEIYTDCILGLHIFYTVFYICILILLNELNYILKIYSILFYWPESHLLACHVSYKTIIQQQPSVNNSLKIVGWNE